MGDAARIEQETVVGQGRSLDLAVLVLETPGLTPVQLGFRSLVVNSVMTPTSKQAYGTALDHLLCFAPAGS